MLKRKIKWRLFSYSKSEFRGFVVLVLILIVLFVCRYMQTKSVGAFEMICTENSPAGKIPDGKARAASQFPEVQAKIRPYKSPESFDPNTANYYQLMSAGFTSKSANNLIKYIEKGGVIRSAEDLSKIYGMDSALIVNLISDHMITISEAYSSEIDERYTSNRIRLEINAADSIELKKLPGIGKVLAARIIKFRDLLGGFYSTEQLSEVYGISDSLENLCVKYISIDSVAIRKIDINTATFEELRRHPYLTSYQAKAILSYRRLIGSFTEYKQLIDNYLINKETYNKLGPYLEIKQF